MRRNAEHVVRRIRMLQSFGLHKRRRPMPRQMDPSGIALAYRQALIRILQRAKALVSEKVIPRLADWEHEAKTWRGDAAGDEVNPLFDQISREFFRDVPNAQLSNLARDFGNRTSRMQKEEFGKQVRAVIGVDVVQAEPWLEGKLQAFAAENVALIKSVPQTYFSEVEKLVLRGVQEGTRPEDIAADIQDRFDVAESKATLIARDQTNKLFGDLNRQRQQDIGVSKFVWRTSMDERVRKSHEELEGETFSWDDPPVIEGERATPGSQVNCRCVADPVLDEILGADEEG